MLFGYNLPVGIAWQVLYFLVTMALINSIAGGLVSRRAGKIAAFLFMSFPVVLGLGRMCYIENLLGTYDRDGTPWIIGGDFNLLPDRASYDRLPPHQQIYFSPQTELNTLLKNYPSTPAVADMSGPDSCRWYTHFPNDPAVKGPDRTIDYIFSADNLQMTSRTVRYDGTLAISDHLPVIVEITIPDAGISK